VVTWIGKTWHHKTGANHKAQSWWVGTRLGCTCPPARPTPIKVPMSEQGGHIFDCEFQWLGELTYKRCYSYEPMDISRLRFTTEANLCPRPRDHTQRIQYISLGIYCSLSRRLHHSFRHSPGIPTNCGLWMYIRVTQACQSLTPLIFARKLFKKPKKEEKL